MQHLLVAGAGRIGQLVSTLLAQSDDYHIHLIDKEVTDIPKLNNITAERFDIDDQTTLEHYLQEQHIAAIVSCLPYFCNIELATIARKLGIHYFDATEDIHVTSTIKELARDGSSAFVPQCGLAPGVVGIIANDLIQQFDDVDKVKMRVGALPTHASNALKYALTWSTDGLINEYSNPCQAIVDRKATEVKALGDLESIELDGDHYEAFNTSGGLGSLVELYQGKVKSLNYKTMRYPGHCEKVRFLLRDLKLAKHRDMLKTILENAIPQSSQDVVIIYVSITGKKKDELHEAHYMKKIYPQSVNDRCWSAIQIATASSLCVVVDLVLSQSKHYHGFVYQEQISWQEFLANRFGQFYQDDRGKCV